MALHIQMSDEALAQLKKAALTSRLVSLAVCAGFLLGFGTILYVSIIVIQGDPPAEFIAYTAPSEDGPPTENPTVKELSAKTATVSPTVTPSVVVAQNAVGAVAAPVSLDTAGEFDFAEADLSLDVEMDLGEGLGSGGPGLGSNKPGGSALQGTFYDLKLTRNGAPSRLPVVVTKDKDGKPLKDAQGKPFKRLDMKSRQKDFALVVQKFFKSWNVAALSTYYKSPVTLNASYWYIPMARAIYAPIAFQCDNVCQDGGWIAVYRGKVKAPKTGKFRFVGTGDDFLGVRFNNKVVLEAGYLIPTLFDEKEPNKWWVSKAGDREGHWKRIKEGKLPGFEGYELMPYIKELSIWNEELGGLTAGKVFEVKQGQEYPIQITICEIPGGGFGCVLFIEDLTDGKKVDPRKGQKFDLFRTSWGAPNARELFDAIKAAPTHDGRKVNCLMQATRPEDLNAPPYNEDSPIWTAVP